MRNIFTIAIFLSCPFLVSAQIKKQSILLGGQLFYYSDKFDINNFSQKAKYANLGISLGKAYKENSVVGITINYSPSRQTNLLTGSDTANTKYTRLDAGVFLRQYKKLASDFYFFGQVDAAFVKGDEKDNYSTSGDVTATQRGAFISLTPGISYRVFGKMYLELTVPNILSTQYLRTKVESQNSQIKPSKTEQILFYSNLNTSSNLGWLGVGFRFVF